jgi:TetR/AcrR family transcriptional regulator
VKQKTPVPGSTKREEILVVAEQVFAEAGFTGASLDNIADRVGIRRPSVLHHFRSKREIYDEVESSIFAGLDEVTRSIPQEGGHMDQLIRLLETWLEFLSHRPTAARIIMRNSSDLVSRPGDPVRFSRGAVEAFERIVNEGIRTGEFRKVNPVLALIALATSLVYFVCTVGQYGPGRDYSYDDKATRGEFIAMIITAANAVLGAPLPSSAPSVKPSREAGFKHHRSVSMNADQIHPREKVER